MRGVPDFDLLTVDEMIPATTTSRSHPAAFGEIDVPRASLRAKIEGGPDHLVHLANRR